MRLNHKHYYPPEVRDDLFTPPSVKIDSSEAAAVSIAPFTANVRDMIYAYVRGCKEHGATLREIAQVLGLNENTARPRCWELEGHAPKGQPKPPRRIVKSSRIRNGMHVYRVWP